MIRRFLPFLTLILLSAALWASTPAFLTARNLSAVVRQTAVINFLALGMTLVIVSGGIDLSVGAILAMSGYLGAAAMARGWGLAAGVGIGLAAGVICGLLNGLLITRLKVSPFIVTLGTLGVYRGLTLILSNGLPVHNLPGSFSILGDGTLAGVPFVLWTLALAALAVHVTLDFTKLGRYAFAIGSNVEAAIYSGVPVAFHTVALYTICGVLAGVAGLTEASRLMSGQPAAGQGYELQAIAAVVIGGGSLRGGQGSVAGTLTGAAIMGLLANGADLLGLNPYMQQAIIGAVIIAAVFLDEWRKRSASAA